MEDFEKWPLLASVNSPQDLKKLSREQMEALCGEVRDYLIFRVSQNGGHLASNLGVVELTAALHRVFDTPHDRIVFDVGHQSYVHKLFTGRKESFDTLREPGGLSGFTRREESEYDPFGAGHSSTAISAALGFAEADAIAGRESWTVAVVGDGALTGGLALEGLNNCRSFLRLLIVINENEMSISKNTGRLAQHLSHIRASRRYLATKEMTSVVLRHIPLVGKPLYHIVLRLKRRLKHALYHENLFEHMGIRYFGPIDGNNLEDLESIMTHIKRSNGNAILHVKTVKGKGYAPAENEASVYHSLPPQGKDLSQKSFSLAMGEALCDAAAHDARICAVTAAMREGTGLVGFSEKYPERFFDVGIAEGHAVTFSAGLAAGGMHPAVAVYSTFLQRALDHVIHDAALQGLPLTLCIDRAGLNAGDGATHHGVFDVALLSTLPNVKILAPVTLCGVSRALQEALSFQGVSAVRYPSGAPNEALVAAFYPNGEEGLPLGVRLFEGGNAPVATVVTHGRIATEALRAAKELATQGIFVRVLLCEYLAPYDTLAREVAAQLAGSVLLFLEEEVRAGGFGMQLSHALARTGALHGIRYEIIGTEDAFVLPQKGQSVFEAASVDAASVKKTLCRLLAQKGEELC